MELSGGFFIEVESSSLVTEENKKTDESDRGEKNGEVNDAVEAPEVGEEAAKTVAEKLTEAEEYRVKAHEQTSIPGNFFGEVCKIGEGSWSEASFSKNAEQENGNPDEK
jgi:hypothetical protein